MDGPGAKEAEDTVRRVLAVLADLAPSGEPRASRLAIPSQWFRWLPAAAVQLFLPRFTLGIGHEEDPLPYTARIDRDLGERLAAVDQVRPGQRSLRVGWLFLAGRTTLADGRVRQVFLPLVTIPVRVHRSLVAARVYPAGDAEVTELVADAELRARLDGRIQLGGGALDEMAEATIPTALLGRLPRLAAFGRDVAAAIGLPAASQLVPAEDGPDHLKRFDGLSIVAGVGIYAVHGTGGDQPGRVVAHLGRLPAGPLDRVPLALRERSHHRRTGPGRPAGRRRVALPPHPGATGRRAAGPPRSGDPGVRGPGDRQVPHDRRHRL